MRRLLALSVLAMTGTFVMPAEAMAADIILDKSDGGTTPFQPPVKLDPPSNEPTLPIVIGDPNGPITNPNPVVLTPSNPVSGAVPEPATWATMIGGLALVGATLRRRKASVRPVGAV